MIACMRKALLVLVRFARGRLIAIVGMHGMACSWPAHMYMKLSACIYMRKLKARPAPRAGLAARAGRGHAWHGHICMHVRIELVSIRTSTASIVQISISI